MINIFKDFTFEAAHKLPNVSIGHKCGRLHGHSYKVRLSFKGKINKNSGWLIDFSKIKEMWKPLDSLLDHNYLNDIEGLENPTCEVLAFWIYENIKNKSNLLYSVEVMETCTCGAIYNGT